MAWDRWRIRLHESFRQQTSLYPFVTILFFTGLVFGIVLVSALEEDRQETLFSYLSNFFTDIKRNSIQDSGAIFQHVVVERWQQLGLMGLLSLSIMGVPFLLGILFLQGLALGFTMSFLMHQLGWHGLGLTLVSVIPHNLLSTPVWLLITAAGMTFSLHFLRYRWWSQRRNHLYPQFMIFVLFVLALSVVLVGSAALEVFLSPYLIEWMLSLLFTV
ncbi:stage II sporulation protein M [Pasteuria penetrans]|uniref:stage II sporulation protein M n=1 Tax=Pasteuria penetrans TaxID=86005 RepID=UPI000F95E8CC|nr:stage II sporulation protein M [Pasteuria penetrans]